MQNIFSKNIQNSVLKNRIFSWVILRRGVKFKIFKILNKDLKTFALEYLSDFSDRWENIESDSDMEKLVEEYKNFTESFNLPPMSADELYLEIKQGKVEIPKTYILDKNYNILYLGNQPYPYQVILKNNGLISNEHINSFNK